MAKYKHKPISVDARQYVGGSKNGTELSAWVNSLGGSAYWTESHPAVMGIALPEMFELVTRFGAINVRHGDWIVEKNDKFHVCPSEEFDEDYEKA